MKQFRRLAAPTAAALALSCLLPRPAQAWWPQAHSIIAEAAVRTLGEKKAVTPVAKDDPIPDYFRGGYAFVAHTAEDPDTLKNDALPHITDSETPEHFIDLELLKGRLLPEKRSQYVRLCNEMKLDPYKVGLLPYSIADWSERLTMAFAEYRRYPHNVFIQQKSLVYAGILAHYAADLCQPLHTTIDYDGRALQDGESPHSGIHTRVDALIERLGLDTKQLQKGQSIGAIPDLMPGIIAELNESHSHIDEAYTLDKDFPDGRVSQPSKEVVGFALERARESTRFTASLFLSAWQKSRSVELPDWLQRG